MATISNIQCPWKKFYKQVVKCMNSLQIEACEPQMKIARFMYAMKYNFASTTMNLTKDSKKSTKQLQGSKKSKIMAQDTSDSDTDSAYNTESESNYTEHLPRPPCSSKATRQHSQPCPNKNQQLINTKCIQKTKPTCIPIPTKSNSKTSHISTSKHQPKPSTSTSHLSTSTCLQKPSTSTRSNTETTIKQPTIPAPKTSTASTYPQCTRKTPLLPIPPASMRNFNYSNHYKQHISRPSAFNNRNPTFTRPSQFYNRFYNQHISEPSPSRYNTYSTFSGPANYRYYPQPHIPRPPCQHQNFSTRPYQQHQQPQGHCTQQVSLPPYVPIIILTPYNQINSILAHQTNLFHPHQY